MLGEGLLLNTESILQLKGLHHVCASHKERPDPTILKLDGFKVAKILKEAKKKG